MDTRANQRTQPSVRLTLFVAALLVGFLLIGGAASADTPPAPTSEYVVESGDTLWGIASRLTPEGGDIRIVLTHIKELSGIHSSTITSGQVLTLPGG